MILFDVTLEANPEAQEAFVSLLRRTMTASRSEPGCLLYRFSADLDEPLRFHLVELWATEGDLLTHSKADAFRNFLAELPPIGRLVSSVARSGLLEPYTFVRPS